MEKRSEKILIETLENNKHFNDYEEIVRFNNALADLIILKNANHLKFLYGYLDDDSEYPEIIDGIIHAIEYYPINDYVGYLLENLNTLYKCSPEQIIRIFYRILNLSETSDFLINNMKLHPQTLKAIFLHIACESANHRKICEKLIGELKNL